MTTRQTILLPAGKKEVEADFHINQPSADDWMELTLIQTIMYIILLNELGVLDTLEAVENIEVAIHG